MPSLEETNNKKEETQEDFGFDEVNGAESTGDKSDRVDVTVANTEDDDYLSDKNKAIEQKGNGSYNTTKSMPHIYQLFV